MHYSDIDSVRHNLYTKGVPSKTGTKVHSLFIYKEGFKMKNNKMIYSDYLETMIPAGFTIRKVLFDKQGCESYKVCKPMHYSWNEKDLLYYSDDIDGEYYMEIPENGKKRLTLKIGKTARTLVILD